MIAIKNPHLQSIVIGGVCLLVAAGLLVSGYLVFFLKFYPEFQSYADGNERGGVSSVVMRGRDFQPSGLVSTEFVGDSQRVLAYVNNRAMLVSSQYLEVGDFPFVRFDVEGIHRDMEVRLIWRRLDMDEGTFHEASLHTSGDGVNWHNMAKYPEWRGTVVEIGIGGDGRSNDERFVLMRDKPFVLKKLELRPFSRLGVVNTIWDEWTYFEGWSHNSMNRHLGVPNHKTLIFPNAAFSLWLLVALVVMVAWAVLKNARSGSVVITQKLLLAGALTIVILVWAVQDSLRMSYRIKQAMDTHTLYADQSLVEKVTQTRLRCDQMRRSGRDCTEDPPLPHL